jgi:hypothetical protein
MERNTFVGAFEGTSKSTRRQAGQFGPRDSRSTRRKECRTVFQIPHLISNRRESLKMTKTTKAMLAGAAFAGLFAGTGAAVKASTLLPSLKTSFSAQDQGQDQKSDKQDKEKHACKGQNSCKGKGGCKASDNGCHGKNSCKGKGGCATDGSKKPE